MAQRILYVMTSGVESPERAYAPFMLASVSKAMDLDASIFFFIKGPSLLKKGAAENVKSGKYHSLREAIDQAVKSGVPLLVCEQSAQNVGVNEGNMIPEAKMVGVATLIDLALECDAVITI